MTMIFKKSIWTLFLISAAWTGPSFSEADWDYLDDLADNATDEQIMLDRAPTITNANVLQFFTTTVKLNNVAADNLYLRTNLISSRELTSLPIFGIYHSSLVNSDWIWQVDLLFNQTLIAVC